MNDFPEIILVFNYDGLYEGNSEEIHLSFSRDILGTVSELIIA